LLSGYFKNIDVNMRSQATGYQMSTALHFAVEINDYDSVKLLLDFGGEPKRELGLKDSKGRNPMDLSVELGFTNIKDLFSRYGGFESSEAQQRD
jgi:ankyrin repeat protein